MPYIHIDIHKGLFKPISCYSNNVKNKSVSYKENNHTIRSKIGTYYSSLYTLQREISQYSEVVHNLQK